MNTNNLEERKCYYLEANKFQELVSSITNNLKEACIDNYGIWFKNSIESKKTGNTWKENIITTLSQYLDINIISIHTDNFEKKGVWIYYK